MKAKTKKGSGLHGLEKAFLMDDDTLLESRWHELELRKLQQGKTAKTGDRTFNPHEIWEKHKEQFLPMFVRKHPGKRPCPWWLFEAPEQRRLKSGGYDEKWQKVVDDYGDEWAEPIKSEHWRLDYGKPGLFEYFDDDLNEIEDLREFESQAEYLKRLDILLPGEKA